MINQQISIQTKSSSSSKENYSDTFYNLLLFCGEGEFEIDFVNYSFSGPTLLFLNPFQPFKWLTNFDIPIQLLKFHGDYYCIEYHKKEVACNGLLFNNIYEKPYFEIDNSVFVEIEQILNKIKLEKKVGDENPFTDSIIKSYLQLILAISSKEKSKWLTIRTSNLPENTIVNFQNLLETHFISERSVSFYAATFALSTNAFSKKIKQHFGKTPTHLIQERVILESKKLLHLTHKSVKQIAAELCFDDEFYFSRYFKKEVGLSPAKYRESVGISIVAEKSMQ